MDESDAREHERSDDTSGNVAGDLLLSARAAARRSGRIMRRSLVLVAISRKLRESRLVVWCAWCGAFSDGKGNWAQIPGFRLKPTEMTASICPACTAEAVAWASTTT